MQNWLKISQRKNVCTKTAQKSPEKKRGIKSNGGEHNTEYDQLGTRLKHVIKEFKRNSMDSRMGKLSKNETKVLEDGHKSVDQESLRWSYLEKETNVEGGEEEGNKIAEPIRKETDQAIGRIRNGGNVLKWKVILVSYRKMQREWRQDN